MSSSKEEEFINALLEWGQDNRRSFPWRETSSPYRILVSEVLLQQTLATKVANVYDEFFSTYPDPDHLARADPDQVAKIIRPCGLQNRKAPALVKIGQQIRKCGFPESYDELVNLPFVNRYAANATLCFAFNERRPVVDVNVVRVYNRVFSFNWEDDQVNAAWEFAEEMLPRDKFQEYNFALLDLAALLCTTKNPACDRCPLKIICDYRKQVEDRST